MRPRLLAALVIAALAVAACGSSEGDSTSDTTLPPTTTTAPPPTTTTAPPPPTTTPPALSSDEALSVADAYFEAYNAGDAEAVLGLFQPDATFSDNFGPQTRGAWEQLLAWNIAQGTLLDAVDCAVTTEDDQSITVNCEHGNLDAVVQAVEGPPVPVTLTLTITPDGISDWEFIFGQPDFLTVLGPFGSWLSANHPEDANSVGFGNWNSVETATENGLLSAQYADVWKTYLEANDCTYSDDC